MGNYIEQIFPSIKAVEETNASFTLFAIIVLAAVCVFNIYFSLRDLKRVFKHRHPSFSQNSYIVFKVLGIIISFGIIFFIGNLIISA